MKAVDIPTLMGSLVDRIFESKGRPTFVSFDRDDAVMFARGAIEVYLMAEVRANEINAAEAAAAADKRIVLPS